MGAALPVVKALREFLPARAILHEEEDTRPYECDGLTAYRQLPMVVALPELADATYVEPITPEIVAKIIEKERPDALLPTMGGQTALNLAMDLHGQGVIGQAPGDGVLLSMAKFMRVLRIDPLARIAVTCRAHGLRPIDGPYGDFTDPEGYIAAARRSGVIP